jgi:hypothetical protein
VHAQGRLEVVLLAVVPHLPQLVLQSLEHVFEDQAQLERVDLDLLHSFLLQLEQHVPLLSDVALDQLLGDCRSMLVERTPLGENCGKMVVDAIKMGRMLALAARLAVLATVGLAAEAIQQARVRVLVLEGAMLVVRPDLLSLRVRPFLLTACRLNRVRDFAALAVVWHGS